MSKFDFSQPTRQSTKGILVIFGYQAFKFFKNILIAFIPLIYGVLNKGSFMGMGVIHLLLIIIGILIIILVFSILQFLNFKFFSSDEGFHLEKGILNKENILIPRAKIQNVYIKQNLLQQLIQVSSLTIETAGNEKAEVEISALPMAYALELKKDLMSKKTIETLEDDSIIYYQASIGKLFLEGVTNNHIKSIVIIGTFFIGLYYENKQFLEDLQVTDTFYQWFSANKETLSTAILINFALAAVLLLVVILFSIVKTILVNYNLTVTEQNKNLEISKGLFNKVNLNLLPSRIQSVSITTNRLKQMFHLNTLHIRQAMTNKNQKDKLSVVGLNAIQVDYLLDHVYSDFKKPESKQKPEFYFKRLLIIRCAILLTILNVIVYFMNDSSFWLINFVAIPYAVLFIITVYKKAFYSVDESFVTVESGFIESVTQIIEVHKIQSVSFTQSIFQKNNHIASLKIGTASRSLRIPYINESHAKDLMDYLLYKVENSQKNWM